MEDLFGREELSNVANNLRVTVHRLKRMLAEAGLPEYDYVKIENGFYRWNSPMHVYVDVADFLDLLGQAEQETEEQPRMELLYRACRLYRGEFLPALSGEDWVIINSVQYKEMYSDALVSVCEYMKKQRDYETILELTSTAAEIYPFDEWQSLKRGNLPDVFRGAWHHALGKDDESVQGNERQDEPEVSGGRRDQRRSEGTAA